MNFILVYYINCLKLQYFIDRYLPVSMEKIQCGIVWLFCIFETSVRAICGVNGIFFILCRTCICMGRIKEGDIIYDLSWFQESGTSFWKKRSMYNLEVWIILTIKLHLKCFRPVFAMIFTTSFFSKSLSLPSSQNSSNIQDDDVTSVHRCTLGILSKAQI